MNPSLERLYPLSSVQSEIWFNQVLHPEDPIYNIGGYIRIRGPIDRQGFENALRSVVRQNDALRTILHEREPVALQEFPESVEFSLKFHDLSGENAPQESALQWMQQALIKPFRLYGQPLFSHALIKVSPQCYFWFFVYHHLIADAWSLSLTAEHVAERYNAPEGGGPETHRPSYIDFIEDDRTYLGSARHCKDKQYWRAKFKDLPAPLISKPYAETNRAPARPGGVAAFMLKRSLFNRLDTFARQNQASSFHMLIGLLYVYFMRVSRAKEFIVGLPLLNRGSKVFKQTLGQFTSVSPARFSLGLDLTFRELIRSLGAELRKDYRHQRFPLVEINRDLGMAEKRGEQLFDVIFSYTTYKFPGHFKNAPADLIGIVHGYQAGTLSFFILEAGKQSDVKVNIRYARDVFREEEIAWLMDRLVFLLNEIIDHPDMRVRDFNLLPPKEYQKIVQEFNDSASDYPRDKTIAGLFEEQVAKAPEDIAVVAMPDDWGRSGEIRLTYRELNLRANYLARRLRQDHGLEQEQIVGVLMDGSEQLPAVLLGILKAGGVYMPIDPAYPKKRVKYMLADAACRLLIADARFGEELGPISGVTVIGSEWDARWCRDETDMPNPDLRGCGQSLAYLIYTSGSTGRPKGSLIVQRSIARLVRHTNYIALDRTSRILQTGSLAFDASTFEIWGALLNGGRLYLSPKSALLDAREARRLINSHQITTLWLTSSLFNQLTDLDPGIFEGLRQLLVGGERLSVPHVNKIRTAHPKLEIINGYGPTENTTFTACYPIDRPFSHDIPIGGPIANTRIYIVDPTDQPLPIGVTGEICISGDGLARGYINNPALTAEKFAPNPFEPGERMYRTGDKGRWLPDGTIGFCGRDDDQLKIRGYRIEPGEIEQRLQEHPGIREAVLVARDFNADGQLELAAYVTGDPTPDIAQVRAFLKTVLPVYMVPTYIVPMQNIPLTTNGKADKKALPDPEMVCPAKPSPKTRPGNAVEKILAGIWQEVLNRAAVRLEDNFFELGGHSLKAALVITRVHEQLGVKLSLATFFAHPTITEQARDIQTQTPTRPTPIPPVQKAETYPVSHAQWRLWVLDKIQGGNVAYNMPLSFWIEGPLDHSALGKSCRDLIRRHESLRTAFVTVNGVAHQKVLDELDFVISHKDLTRESHPEAAALSLAREEALTPFDLGKAPLMRITLLKIDSGNSGREASSEKHVLLFCMHHIISDEWSLNILFQELGRGYDQYSAAAPGPQSHIPATPSPIQYKDYAAWHNHLLSGREDIASRDFWHAQLAAPLPVLDIPLDFPRPPVWTFSGDFETFPVSSIGIAKLDAFCSQRGISRFILLCALVKVLLFRYTGSKEIITGSPVAGRDHTDLQSLIGFFVNTLALRDQVDGQATFDEFLGRVKQTTLEAFDHQRYPFDRLVEELDVPRDPGRSPLFDVMVTLRDDANLKIRLGETQTRLFDRQYRIAKFDLMFSFVEERGGLSLEIEYRTDLFLQTRIQRMGGHFFTLLDEALTYPDRAIRDLAMLPTQEHHSVQDRFNRTAAAYPQNKTLTTLFESQAQRSPDRPAVLFGEKCLTYAQLQARADTLARCLAGILPGKGNEPVAVLMDRSHRIISTFLGVLKAGHAYVPIDPTYPLDRKRFILKDSGCRVILTEKRYLADPVLTAPDNDLRAMVVDIGNLPQGTGAVPRAKILPDHAAYIIYTSGSTGQPKGCVVTHRNVVRLLKNDAFPFDFNAGDIWAAAHAFCFDFSVWEMYGALLYGGCLAIAEPQTVRDALAFRVFIRRHKVTVLNQTPGAFYQLMAVEQEAAQHDLDRHLRYVIFGGDRLDPAALQPWVRHYPLDAIKLINMYGITETTVHVTFGLLTHADVFNGRGQSPVGRPLPETRVYVCDERMHLCPIGIAGELYVGGTGVCRGYLNRSELTARKFLDSPFRPGEKLYRSGDLGCWQEDGTLAYLGRNDDQVQIRGYRIELGEIENRLRQFAAVKKAAVLTRAVGNQGPQELVAYMTSDEPLAVEALREHLRRTLPEHMIPSCFIQVEKIPLTANAKVDKKALAGGGAPLPTGTHQEPQTVLEEQLLSLWRQYLNTDRIGVQDNFFDVGGNSLLLVKLYSDINAIYPQKLNITDLFTHTTISDVAAFIEKKNASPSVFQKVHARVEKQKQARLFRNKTIPRYAEERNADASCRES
jgi:tyrocidine synthetase III